MAIINCPQCSTKISDKQKICPHCELDMTDLSEEKMQSLSKINSLKNQQSMMTHQVIAMLMFLGGVFGWYNSEDPESPQHTAAIAVTVIGFLWYIVNRVRIILAKRKRK